MIFEYRYYFCICPYVYKNDWNIVFLVNYLLQIWSLKDFTIKKLLILVKEEVNTILQLSLCRKAININVSDLVSLLYILLLLNNFLSAIQVWKKKKNIVYSTTLLRTFKIFLFVKIQKIQHELFSLKMTLECSRISLLFKFSIDESIVSLLNYRSNCFNPL